MAKNWTAAEAAKALLSGDKEARMEIGKRFPLFATATAEEIIEALPAKVTARKIEMALRGDVEETSEETNEVEDEEEAKPAKKSSKKAAKKVEVEDDEDEDDDEDDEDDDF